LPKSLQGDLNGAGRKIGIVVSRFNEFVTSRLLEGAVECLVGKGVKDKDIEVAHVPGAFEIPTAAKRMVERRKYDAILCLGAVIRGGTPHFEYVAGEAAKGVGKVALEASIPVLFGVLTTDNLEQAVERAGAKSGNKGWETALAAIEMINLYKQL
jgi:6,7-dimethyl-8-ribityllumazine synthase